MTLAGGGFDLDKSVLAFLGADEEVANYRRLHLAFVGAVAAAWSGFEASIDDHILILGQIAPDVGRCLTAQLVGFGSRLDAYASIVRLRCGAKFAGELEDFANVTAGLSRQRNRVVHDPWMQKERNVIHRRETTARRILRHEEIAVPLPEIDALVQKIADHHDKFKALSARIEQHAFA